MNIIRSHAFSTILIFLTALVLPGCAPNYYTRDDGRKMSAAERKEVCKRLRSAASLPEQYNINAPFSSAYRQQENVAEIRRQAQRNAEQSMSNLNCEDFDPQVQEARRIQAETSMKDYERAKRELDQGLAAGRKFAEEKGFPEPARRFVPQNWGEDAGPLPDITGAEWKVAACYEERSYDATLQQCPGAFRFLANGGLGVSTYEFGAAAETTALGSRWSSITRGAPAQYGPAQSGSWVQRGNKLYLKYRISKGGAQKDAHVYATVLPHVPGIASNLPGVPRGATLVHVKVHEVDAGAREGDPWTNSWWYYREPGARIAR